MLRQIKIYLRSMLKNGTEMHGRSCLYLNGDKSHGLHHISLVVENEPGYFKCHYVPSVTDMSDKAVNEMVNSLNEELGISEDESMDIVMSSMKLGKMG